LVLDSCISYLLEKDASTSGSLDIKEFTEKAIKMINLLDHEFYARDNAKPIDELINTRLTQLEKFKEITLTKDGKIVLNKADTSSAS